MAVSALELRPRGAVALLDASLRLCARNTGVWALTLPSGALVLGALLHLTDTVTHHRPLALPVLWLTLAWLVRGLFQGASRHYVQELLLGTGGEPSVWASLQAALARAPSLLGTVGYLFVFNAVTLLFSMGLSVFFVSAHVVGYSTAMMGRGSVLSLYRTSSRLLGPARGTASSARLLLWVAHLLVFLNLHLGANFLFLLGRKLVGIDLTYAERFASLDNATWMLFVAALTFVLFEPVKAAASTLLLVDGRVRQDGLDLLAAVQQLPARRTDKAGVTGVRGAALVLLCALLAGAPAARAQEANMSSTPLGERLSRLATECDRPPRDARQWSETAEALSLEEQRKFQRLVRRAESLVRDEDDCDEAMGQLQQGVTLARETVTVERARQDARASAARAQAILQRPEFVTAPPSEKDATVKEPTVPPDTGWWRKFWDWVAKKLEEWFKRRDTAPPPGSMNGAGGFTLASSLAVVLFGAALVVMAGFLIRAMTQQKRQGGAQLEVSTLESSLSSDPASALSRPPEGWAHAADELAAQGQYREAVRCLYLALLSRLHREGAITYDVTLSNWDYLRHFKGRREWLPSFRELTRRFDFAWYGNLPVGSDGYHDFRALTEPLLRAPATVPEAAGA